MRRFFVIDQTLAQPGGHYFEYSTAIAVGAMACGFEPKMLVNRGLTTLEATALPAGVALIPWFTHRWDQGAYEGPTTFGPTHFGQELLAGLERHVAGPADIVLVHTLGWHQLAQLLDILLSVARSRMTDLPAIAVLLRYDPRDLDPNMRNILRERLGRLSQSWALRSKVFLFTDTDRLTDLCGNMLDFPFATLPIPFNQSHLTDALPSKRTATRRRPLTIAYAGDARDEKGYALFPAAVTALWHKYVRPGHVRFVFQSNFNIAAGEPAAAQARAQLERFPEPQVTLLKEPLGTRDYYEMIAAADILVIPYDPARYEARSSGVLVEALTAGKVVVTTRGSWMETQIADAHAVLFEEDQVGSALETAIVNFDRLAAGARALQPHWLKISSPAHFVERIVAATAVLPAAEADGPAVLLVMDAESMVLRNGASRVVLNQLNFLFRAGYRVTGLFVSSSPTTLESLFDLRRRLDQELASLPFHDLHLAGYAPDADGDLAYRINRDATDRGEYSIARDLAGRRGIAVPDLLRRRLEAAAPTFVLLNYVFNLPVLDALPLKNVPILCEMHDIQSYQRAIYAQRALDPRDMALEFEWLARCDFILALNDLEADTVQSKLPDMKLSYIPILSRTRPSLLDDLTGASDLPELVSQCGCARLTPSSPKYDAQAADRLAGFPTIDLLVVSSGHLSNVSGLVWFFEQVYFPYLEAAGVTILVAGTISDLPGWPDHDKIVFSGSVERLETLYAAARLVALPIIEGAGSPVKTIEALATGKAIVATTIALRGLGAQADLLQPTDSPAAFAARIKTLLADPQARGIAGRTSLEASRSTITADEYNRRLASAIRQLIGPSAPSAPPESAFPSPDCLVEWGPQLAILNRALDALVTDGPIDIAALIAAKHIIEPAPGRGGPKARGAAMPEDPADNPGRYIFAQLFDIWCRKHKSGIPLVTALELLKNAQDSAIWTDRDGRSRDAGTGRLALAPGEAITRALFLRAGQAYAIEIVTNGKKGCPKLRVDETTLACGNSANHGDGNIHRYEFRVGEQRGALAKIVLTVEAAEDCIIEDIRISRNFQFDRHQELIEAPAILPSPGRQKTGSPSTAGPEYCWMEGAAGRSIKLPLLGSPELRVRLTISQAQDDTFAHVAASIGGNHMRRVREYHRPHNPIIEFTSGDRDGVAKARSGPNSLHLSLPINGNEWPHHPIALSAIEISESLLAIDETQSALRNEAFKTGRLTVEGYVDQVTTNGLVHGWARCPEIPRLRLTVHAVIGDRSVTQARADGFRADLRAAGKGDGYSFFSLDLSRLGGVSDVSPIHIFIPEGNFLMTTIERPRGQIDRHP